MKQLSSRIFGTSWVIDDSTARYNHKGAERSFSKLEKIVAKKNSDENPDALGEEMYEVQGKSIPFCPRGYVVAGIWCPTIETAAALSAENGGADIDMYDEVV